MSRWPLVSTAVSCPCSSWDVLYCQFPFFHLKSTPHHLHLSTASAPPVFFISPSQRFNASCISFSTSSKVSPSLAVWIRSVSSTNAYPTILIGFLEIDVWKNVPEPSSWRTFKKWGSNDRPDNRTSPVALIHALHWEFPAIQAVRFSGITICTTDGMFKVLQWSEHTWDLWFLDTLPSHAQWGYIVAYAIVATF